MMEFTPPAARQHRRYRGVLFLCLSHYYPGIGFLKMHTNLRGGELKLEHKNSLGFRQIAEEWSREPGNLPYSEVLTELLRAYWKGEFAGEDAPDREATLKVLNFIGAMPYQYRDDESPPKDDYEFLAELPPDGYDETAAECYDEVAWSVLNGVKIPKQVLANWCDAKGISKPTFWFGKFVKSSSTVRAKTQCARWFQEEVKKEKSGNKNDYRLRAQERFSNLSGRSFGDVWRDVAPASWKRAGAPRRKGTDRNS